MINFYKKFREWRRSEDYKDEWRDHAFAFVNGSFLGAGIGFGIYLIYIFV